MVSWSTGNVKLCFSRKKISSGLLDTISRLSVLINGKYSVLNFPPFAKLLSPISKVSIVDSIASFVSMGVGSPERALKFCSRDQVIDPMNESRSTVWLPIMNTMVRSGLWAGVALGEAGGSRGGRRAREKMELRAVR